MAATNVARNFQNLKLDAGTAFTSVKNISVSDGTGRIQDGSDNDTDFTLNVNGPFRTAVTVTFRDAEAAYALETQEGTLTWDEVGLVGDTQSFSVAACRFGQVDADGPWGELRTYVVRGEGGRLTKTST